jgi:hypothetical protein
MNQIILTFIKNVMIYLISIPHQTEPRLYDFKNKEAILDYVNRNDFANTIAEAMDILTHDWHNHIWIEEENDLERALEYTGHQQYKVRSLAEQLNNVEIEIGEEKI